MLKDLLNIANELDKRNLTAEADLLDDIIKTATRPNMFPIRKGDKGKRDLIRTAQEALLRSGYHMAAGADGFFGKQTEAAVRAFQVHSGLLDTGFLTQGEYESLVTEEDLDGKRIIVAIGDSITDNNWQGASYTVALEKRVKGSRTFTFGYGGKQTTYILGKLNQALAKNPDDIIILAGVNDIASGKSVEHITGNLQKMYRASREAGARVIAVKILPWHGRKRSKGKEYVTKAVNSWIENSPDVDVVVEGSRMHSDDPSRYEMNKEYTNDKIHPNEKGKEILAEIIANKAFKEEFEEDQSIIEEDWEEGAEHEE